MSKFWTPFFLGQSLLLSTTILNDKCITDYSDNIQAVNISASSGINQLDKFSVNIATVQYVSNDEASGDRAENCFISNHYQCNGRRRFVTLQVATTGKYNIPICMPYSRKVW